MTRRILLTLANDTTETHCGSCPMAAEVCPVDGPDALKINDGEWSDIRTVACVAAERAAVEWEERAERAEAGLKAARELHASFPGSPEASDVIARQDVMIVSLRADLARVTAERDTVAAHRAKVEAWLDDAIARVERAERELSATEDECSRQRDRAKRAERERDARPNISAEDCMLRSRADFRTDEANAAMRRIDAALCEHAKLAKGGDDA